MKYLFFAMVIACLLNLLMMQLLPAVISVPLSYVVCIVAGVGAACVEERSKR